MLTRLREIVEKVSDTVGHLHDTARILPGLGRRVGGGRSRGMLGSRLSATPRSDSEGERECTQGSDRRDHGDAGDYALSPSRGQSARRNSDDRAAVLLSKTEALPSGQPTRRTSMSTAADTEKVPFFLRGNYKF